MNNKKNNKVIIKEKTIFLNYLCKSKSPFLKNLTLTQIQRINDFKELVKSKFISYEFTACLCGNEEFELISSIDRYSMPQQTAICTCCGLVLSNPRMSEDSYEYFYSSDLYRDIYSPDNNPDYFEKNYYNNDTGKHIFEAVSSYLSSNKDIRILEFGAGGGWNLIPFIDAGLSVTGIEYSSNLVELGKKHGVNMKQGGIEAIESKYDLIILNHVLEHFADPVESTRNLMRHLKTDGLLYIAAPNILNFSMSMLQNAHTYYFTPELFSYYLCSAGLKLLKFGKSEEIHMYGVFRNSFSEKNRKAMPTNHQIIINRIKMYVIKELVTCFLEFFHIYRPLKFFYHSLKKRIL